MDVGVVRKLCQDMPTALCKAMLDPKFRQAFFAPVIDVPEPRN